MPAFTATAPGKIILFGEHAVVYRRPALAVPVNQVKARATVSANPLSSPGELHIQAPDVDLETRLADLPADHPIAQTISGVLDELGAVKSPACTVRITSTIPIAAGLGSGAAVSVAIIRALSAFLGRSLPDERVSALAYEVEKLHHGTPSGIDNAVVTYAMPVYFVRGDPKVGGSIGTPGSMTTLEPLVVPVPFTIVIGDSGISSPTSLVVSDVRRAWQDTPDHYDNLFDAVERITQIARRAIEGGQPEALGPLMNENHALLQQINVSSPELDKLVEIARRSGALGAKLSGAGRGGNMIALVNEDAAPVIAQALLQNGATRAIITTVRAPGIT
jgi:mevalonate kinase